MRLQRQFVRGLPDVGLKHPKLDLRFVEVKHLVYAKIPNTIEIETSSLQRMELKKMRAAGIMAGWCCFVTIGSKHYYIPSMGQIYAKTVILPPQLLLWDKSENALLSILQSI